jgi:hypothetical protein
MGCEDAVAKVGMGVRQKWQFCSSLPLTASVLTFLALILLCNYDHG